MGTIHEGNIPHNLEAERALLGSILLDNASFSDCHKLIGVNDFFSANHRMIYQAMVDMLEGEGRPVEIVTICEHLMTAKLLERAGGPAYIATLSDGVPIGATVAVAEYCRIVKEKSKARRLLDIAQSISAKLSLSNGDLDTVLAEVNEQLQDLRFVEKQVEQSGAMIEVKGEPETAKKKSKKSENVYPSIRREAWHAAAELYRLAHDNCTEGSDNWHFASFYTIVGAMMGRMVGTRMGGRIFGNLYSVLIGAIGGDGKDTVADFATDFMERIEPNLYMPEEIDSKAGFCKTWMTYNVQHQIAGNHRCLLRLPEISSYLYTAEQSGTKSIGPMLLTQYSPRPWLRNASVQTAADIHQPHFALLACGAKQYIGEIDEKILVSGLGRRLCCVPGDPKGPIPRPKDPDQTILNNLVTKIRERLEYYVGRKECFLKLSSESEKLWDDWYKTYWKRKRGDDLIPALNNGDRTSCRKVALINAFLDGEEEFIKPEQLKPAMAFCEFLYESRWPIFSEHGANPFLDIEKKILAKVPENPSRISLRWLQQHCGLDSKTFRDRIKYLTMDDGELITKKDGKRIWVWRREE